MRTAFFNARFRVKYVLSAWLFRLAQRICPCHTHVRLVDSDNSDSDISDI